MAATCRSLPRGGGSAAALPPAHVYATAYGRGTTLLSVPVLLGIVALVG